MKKRTLYSGHSQKLILASLISTVLMNHAHAGNVNYGNQVFDSQIRVSSDTDDLNFKSDHTTFNNGLGISTNHGYQSQIDIENSDINSSELVGTGLSIINNGNSFLKINNSIIKPYDDNYLAIYLNNTSGALSEINISDSEILSTSFFSAVNNQISVSNSNFSKYLYLASNNNTEGTFKNSSFSDGIIVTGESASLDFDNVEISNAIENTQSTLNVKSAKDSDIDITNSRINGSILVSSGSGYVAKLQIADNSQIIGDISTTAQENGSSSFHLSSGSTVNGNVTLNGETILADIDSATLSGNIFVGRSNDIVGTEANTTVNIANTVYRGNITSTNDFADDSLTLSVNNGGIIGGEAVDSAQNITGFNRVSANINYVDPSLVNTGKASYFFFNEGEQVTIANSVDGRYISDTVRTGSYVLDRIGYKVTDESAAQGLADTGYYSIVFDANEMPPTPLKPPLPPLPVGPVNPLDPVNPVDPADPVNPVDPADPVNPVEPVNPVDPIAPIGPVNPPSPEPRIAADLQAAQAGLLASDDMIHRIAGSITQHLDARHMSENSAQTADNNVWMDGIYSGGDRTAGTTEYSNDISGFQLGADTSWALANGDTVSVGAGLGYLHNDLDVTSSDGSNDIDGNYYSLYASWTQNQTEGKNWHLFVDTTATYGDMSYSASGKDGTLKAGGDYNGNSWLWQARAGAQINLAQDWWIQPYTVLGYSQTETDAYSDGYSHVSDGKFSAGFAGAGVKAGKNITLKGGQVLRPYIETSYVGRFSEDTKFNTSDYNFGGQNLNGGSIGAGLNAQLSKNWSTTAKVNTLMASDVSNEVHGYLGAEFKF